MNDPDLATFEGTISVRCGACGAQAFLETDPERAAGNATFIGRFAVLHMHGWSEKARTRTQIGDVDLTFAFTRQEGK